MQQKLLHMLQLQDALNRRIDPDWLQAGHAWHRAIWLEAAELMEHYGWKWWKAQRRDLDQLRLELIDIWHFGLSAELARRQGDPRAAARALLRGLDGSAGGDGDFRANVERLALHALAERTLHLPAFMRLLEATQTGFGQLYRIYVGKNVLNHFRQAHGYDEGTYVKRWAGREDNEHLAELCAGLDAEGAEFEARLRAALEARYAQATAAAS